MDTNVSIFFKNLTYSGLDPEVIKLELEYENKNIEFNYPLSTPLKLSLSKKFIFDKVNLILSIIELGKKMKVIYKGTLVLNKNIFLESNSTYEKLITLIPTEIFTRDLKKDGRIYAEVKILDNFEEWKKDAKLLSKKKLIKNLINMIQILIMLIILMKVIKSKQKKIKWNLMIIFL